MLRYTVDDFTHHLDNVPPISVMPISVMIILMKEALFHKQNLKKSKKHIQQLRPIVRGGKPQREGVINSRDKIRNAQGVKYDKLYWGCKPHTTSHRRLDCVKRFRFNGSGSSSCSRSLIDCLLTSINYSLFNSITQLLSIQFNCSLHNLMILVFVLPFGHRLTN